MNRVQTTRSVASQLSLRFSAASKLLTHFSSEDSRPTPSESTASTLLQRKRTGEGFTSLPSRHSSLNTSSVFSAACGLFCEIPGGGGYTQNRLNQISGLQTLFPQIVRLVVRRFQFRPVFSVIPTGGRLKRPERRNLGNIEPKGNHCERLAIVSGSGSDS
jgi:hypothetical protein